MRAIKNFMELESNENFEYVTLRNFYKQNDYTTFMDLEDPEI